MSETLYPGFRKLILAIEQTDDENKAHIRTKEAEFYTFVLYGAGLLSEDDLTQYLRKIIEARRR